MKKLALILATLVLTMGCFSNQQKNTENKSEETATKSVATYNPEQILEKGDSLIGQEVLLKGHITHTCKHSGARCFVVGDSDPNISIRVEAKGEIGGFNRDLSGSEVIIKGFIRENRLTMEYIDQYEEAVNERSLKEDGSAETCAAEYRNIEQMRKWMKDNNKDYYSIYYMDGMSYEVVK